MIKIKKTKLNIVLFISLLMSSSLEIASAHPDTKAINQPILQKLLPAVVNISVQKKMDPQVFALLKQRATAPTPATPPALNYLGSGVIVDSKKGYIITNNHVINKASAIIVTLKSGDHYLAKLIAADKADDLAVLQIKTREKLIAMPFADSTKVALGQNVIAIGHPFGLRETVTSGIISALDRAIPMTAKRTQSFIQTDAPINPGNSGGALIDSKGSLVGINTAILSNSDESAGIGFAIPSNTVRAVYQQLVKYKNVKHGMLGVVVQNVTPEIAKTIGLAKNTTGIIVTDVKANSAAEKAGLKVTDIILQVNNRSINDAEQLHDRLSINRPGSLEHFTILRQGKKIKATASLMTMQQAMMVPVVPYFNGMQLANYAQLQADGSFVQGIMIKKVSPTCNGALAGLSRGDIITQVGSDTSPDLQKLGALTRNAKKPLLVRAKHGGVRLLAVLNP